MFKQKQARINKEASETCSSRVHEAVLYSSTVRSKGNSSQKTYSQEHVKEIVKESLLACEIAQRDISHVLMTTAKSKHPNNSHFFKIRFKRIYSINT